MFRKYFNINILYILLLPALAVSQSKSSFKIVPLGVKGGIDESNLSAYMVAPAGSNDYVCLDAGTLHYGIEKAVANKVFNIPAEQVLKKYIRACLNFIGEIYYAAIFERNKADFFCIAGLRKKNPTKLQPKIGIRNPVNKF